jgi:hypothetical protein
MPASRSIVSVLLRGCEDFLYTLKAGPAGGLRPPSGPAATRRLPRGRPRRTLPAGGPLEVLGTSGRYPTRAVDPRSPGVGTGREGSVRSLGSIDASVAVPSGMVSKWRPPTQLPCFPSADRTHREDELSKWP